MVRKTFVWENIIDEETLAWLSELWGMPDFPISAASLIQGVLMEMRLSPSGKVESNFGKTLKTAYFRLANNPHYYEVLSLLFELLENGLYQEFVAWYKEIV